ncbi:flagellar motor protein MotB [Candidatus Phycosocius spiralis]|uniref:Chemotaxis protein MotB n=1 Tax=Candidatus Phycosocius spiralis TaxID=2815099 RepID=A0ABQ4PS87_9PROT|nr:flagellar motor protein MotB [Candidatus Phycosocius spiralis]GIU65879.1 chemotaxis protein MotB [Candidatus Phycosocius spiralis]
MSSNRPIIIKKVKKVAGGHHGGAWKVAYADFVTAMMAFFLLMWLINTTSPDQKRGIADYFAPASVSPSTSGAGGILGGTALGEEGALQKGATPIFETTASATSPPSAAGDQSGRGASTSMDNPSNEALAQRKDAEFAQAEISLRQALQDMPELAELSRNIIVDQTPEGLRIQLVDQEGRPMFEPGSSVPNDRARLILQAAARIIQALPNRIAISGHTDATPNPDPRNSNWELSAARANAARRILLGAGVGEDRIAEVSGRAGSDPLFPDDPYQAANRRIAIVLQRASSPLPEGDGL